MTDKQSEALQRVAWIGIIAVAILELIIFLT